MMLSNLHKRLATYPWFRQIDKNTGFSRWEIQTIHDFHVCKKVGGRKNVCVERQN